MDYLELYDGTMHPEVWVNKIKTYCYRNQITKNEDIVEFCKSMIHPYIKVTGKDLNEIINCLKQDITFISFKDSIKRKIHTLKFGYDDDDYSLFLQLCYEG